MIARTWRGATRAAHADAYTAYIADTGLRAYAATPGNLGSLILTRRAGDANEPATEFLVVSFWDSHEAVERFAGPEPEKAVFYPEDDRYLIGRDLTVDHYDVVARRDAPTDVTP